MLERQPDDHIRHICSFLDFLNIFKLSQVSNRFNGIYKYIRHVVIDKKYTEGEYQLIVNVLNSKYIQSVIITGVQIKETILKDIIQSLPISLQVFKITFTTIPDSLISVLKEYLKLSNLQIFIMTDNKFKVKGVETRKKKKRMIHRLKSVLKNHVSVKEYEINGNTCATDYYTTNRPIWTYNNYYGGPGGLMSLVAHGAADIALIAAEKAAAKPTDYKTIYNKSHTNFIKEKQYKSTRPKNIKR